MTDEERDAVYVLEHKVQWLEQRMEELAEKLRKLDEELSVFRSSRVVQWQAASVVYGGYDIGGEG